MMRSVPLSSRNDGPPLSPPQDIAGAPPMEKLPASTAVTRTVPLRRLPVFPWSSMPNPTTRVVRPTTSVGSANPSSGRGATGASSARSNTPRSFFPALQSGCNRPSTTRTRSAGSARAVSGANTTESTCGTSRFSTQCAAVRTTRGATSVPVQVTGAASTGSPQMGETGTIAPTAG